MTTPDPAPPASPPAPADTRLRGLLPDYNRVAAAYWWLLALAGALALGMSAVAVAAMSSEAIWQIVIASGIAAMVGLIPLRIPKTKNSIAAGDIFIFLLLPVHGPFAAAIAAAAEAAACAWRTSDRWSSRIAGPAAAAVSMLACGHLFTAALDGLEGTGVFGDGVTFIALLAFAALYFVVGPTVVTTVIYLKRRRAPTPAEWLTTFGWLGMNYLGSASIAGVLFIAFQQFGAMSVLVATPMIGMFVTSLRVYFAQQEATEREAAERTSRERAEAAERESAMAARHLRELEASDRRFESAFAHAAIGMALVERDGCLLQVNRALCELFGVPEPLLLIRTLPDLIDTGDLPMLEGELAQVRAGKQAAFRCELRGRHEQGDTIWLSLHVSAFGGASAAEGHLIIQAFDATARHLAEERLQHLAYHDPLTNLPNSRRLYEAVEQAVRAYRNGSAEQFSVLHLSFDRVNLLNDSLGRGVGDQFLIAVSARLQAAMRPDNLLARLEGDDFAILALHRHGGTPHAIALAERLQRAFAASVLAGSTEVYASASIGISFSDTGYQRADDVLRDARLAMVKARGEGQGRCALFDPSLHEQASERLMLETELRRALDAGQLALAFQPVYAIAPQRLVGFEALARWPFAGRGAIPPGEFIPVAEASGLIVPLTRWALRAACGQLRQWRERHPGAGELFVNVNISGQDLCEAGFADLVRDTLAEHGLPERCLTLEITETTLMQQLETGRHTLARLRDLGVGLSVDDFGTGYSSLGHLSTLPITSLKIDRSFVDRLDGVSVETEIVRAVVQLGRTLGKRVIAEGVETVSQLERLRALECDYAQGFLLARPLSVAQVEALLAAAPSAAPAGREPSNGVEATAIAATAVPAVASGPAPALVQPSLPGVS